jgi:hypothetical protein
MGIAIRGGGEFMKACSKRQETLWLDIYEELNPNERQAWEQHLENCPGCREERQRLLHLLQRVKDEMPPPELSVERARALSWSIKRVLRDQGAVTRWRKRILGVPNRLIPALVAACLLIGVFGWFTIDKLQSPSTFQNLSGLNSEEQMSVKDLEVIDNLELLEELDTLQKLVQVVDHREIM